MTPKPIFISFLARVLILAILTVSVSCLNPPVDDGDKKENTGGTGGEDGEGPVFLGAPPVLINEINVINTTYSDEYGNYPRWAELYNPADTAVNLNGYYLSNDANRLIWAFGDVTLAPKEYLTVFMSGKNQPDFSGSGGGIDLIGGSVGAWSWGDSQNGPPEGPGSSTAACVPASCNIVNGVMGGALNAVSSTTLTWASAVVMMVFSGWDTTDVIDLSGINQISMRGTVSKDSRLEIRLAQSGMNDWETWPAVITGTGIENDLYTIMVPQGTDFPNLAKIYGLRFANPPNDRGAIDFSFTSIIAQKAAAIHASFELNANGGRLFLLDSDGRIRDSVAYLAGMRGLSYARDEKGGWAFSKPPTPGGPNVGETYDGQVQPPPQSGIPASGYYENQLVFTLPSSSDGSVTCCDTTGRFPAKESALRSGAALSLTQTTVMRCAQFREGSYTSEAIMRTYIIGGPRPTLPVVSIAVDPVEMFDPATGLYSMGPNAGSQFPFYGANFWRKDELPIHLDFFENGMRHEWSYPAGIRIFGNWSRGSAKKSVLVSFRDTYGGPNNLRYPLFPDHPHLTRFKHFILRNNGNNFDQDYIRDMLMSSLTDGLNMNYQKGRAVIVFYNGQYFGIHNLRERANTDYFRTNYDIDDDLVDLVKASGEVSGSGSDADYQSIVNELGGLGSANIPLTDDELKKLGERIDISDFTNHYQARIYYNDRDWPGNNIKRWRSAVSPVGTKWRWLMYDTDHGWDSHGKWHRPDLTSLQFATASNGPDWPNPPHSTFMLRKLLTNENYKRSFINRFSLMIATYYAPPRVEARINALMAPIESEIPRDQQRWKHDVARMDSELNVIRNFGGNRPAQMQREMEDFFKLSDPVNFTVSANGNGTIFVHDMQVMNANIGATFKTYASVPIIVKAVPNLGSAFKGWSDGENRAERMVTVEESKTLTANFE